MERFKKKTLNEHERNKRHIISMQRWIDYRLVQNKNELSEANQVIHVRQNYINENRSHVLFSLKVTLYLAKLGLPFLELLDVFSDAHIKKDLHQNMAITQVQNIKIT